MNSFVPSSFNVFATNCPHLDFITFVLSLYSFARLFFMMYSIKIIK